MNKKYIALCVLIALGIVALMGCGRQSYLQDQTRATAQDDTNLGETEGQGDASSGDDCFVQVSGAVKNPGVYQLPVGSRVYQAIEKAGGLRDDACAKDLNQARVLTDGEMIHVNTVEESEAEMSPGQGDDRVNINTATAEELTSLPGIGKTRAQTIIDYRESNGLFSAPEDLMKVSGIGESTYNKLSGAIKVN
ncbi:MAG: ComEA family DNA-binding protein [Lachnospiraceae bacterium]|nr:ComEA family DNA-binding protein [Lachnospiraceae bacterium]